MTKNAFEMYAACRVASDVHNDPVMYVDPSETGAETEVRIQFGRPDKLIDETDIGPNELLRQRGIGHPDELFVHAGDVARYTGCSFEAASNWLAKFERAGLVKRHGDGTADVNGDATSVKLYRPIVEDPEAVMMRLYELNGEQPPDFLVATETVTPSQFEHIEGSRFRYTVDSSVEVDVAKPDAGTIREHVLAQLRQSGLTPSSPKNFIYELRSEAGLT